MLLQYFQHLKKDILMEWRLRALLSRIWLEQLRWGTLLHFPSTIEVEQHPLECSFPPHIKEPVSHCFTLTTVLLANVLLVTALPLRVQAKQMVQHRT